MIENDNQFHITLRHLGRLLDGLEDLRKTLLPQNPQMFGAMSDGVLEDINRLRIELKEYERQTKLAS